MSIWRVLFRTFFYVAPRVFASSRDKAISLENLRRPEKPKVQTLSRSLGNSRNSLLAFQDSPYSSQSLLSSSFSDSLDCPSNYSSFERGIDRGFGSLTDLPRMSSRNRSYSMTENTDPSFRHQENHQFKKYQTSSPQYKYNRMDSEENRMEMRRRSQSFSYPTPRYQDSSDNEEIDLDLHISTPYSEQWNQKHYLSPEIPEILTPVDSPTGEENKKYFGCLKNPKDDENKAASKSNYRLSIPSNPASSDDDDEVTPEVKYVGILMNDGMFNRRRGYDSERNSAAEDI